MRYIATAAIAAMLCTRITCAESWTFHIKAEPHLTAWFENGDVVLDYIAVGGKAVVKESLENGVKYYTVVVE